MVDLFVLCTVMQKKEEKKKESNKRQEQRDLTQERLIKVQKNLQQRTWDRFTEVIWSQQRLSSYKVVPPLRPKDSGSDEDAADDRGI